MYETIYLGTNKNAKGYKYSFPEFNNYFIFSILEVFELLALKMAERFVLLYIFFSFFLKYFFLVCTFL